MQCITALLAVLLAVFSLAECHGSPAEGEPCTVRNPERCEDSDLEPSAVMMSDPEPVEDGFGPNVCVTRRMETVSIANYAVKLVCKTRFRRQFCYPFCARGENCTLRNITTSVYDCCAGFAAPSSSRDHGFGYGHFNRHPGYRTLRRVGCTIELRPSVVECLTELNLTDFQAALVDTELGGRLASAEEEFTVFAPTNDAISGQSLSESSLMTHVLDEVVKNSDLRSFAVLRPLNTATLLHVTDVHIFSSRYRWFFKFTEETYINGAELLRGDACLAENGVVHTVKSIIPSSPDSIAELLAADPQFSDFTRLLEATNISQFLGPGRNTSRTVFAPTNDAFAKLPAGAVDCLLRPENKRHAKQLVLTHITAPAEYTSSLSQRRYVKTFYFYRRLLVCVINDTIHLTRDNIPLSETDITARNGVIHSLETVLLSDCLDYEQLCPTTPSPTPEVTTPSPTPEVTTPSPTPEVTENPEQLPTSVEETGSGESPVTPTFPLPIIPSEPGGPINLRSF